MRTIFCVLIYFALLSLSLTLISFSCHQMTDTRKQNMFFSYTNSKGSCYYLHGRTTILKNGREQIIYFFAKEVQHGALECVPSNYIVAESKNGLPILKKG